MENCKIEGIEIKIEKGLIAIRIEDKSSYVVLEMKLCVN